ncbi:hypothetical protein Lser_V15G22904 [Lactuca serriola]
MPPGNIIPSFIRTWIKPEHPQVNATHNPVAADIHAHQNPVDPPPSGFGQPPSVGVIRPFVASIPYGSNQMHNGALPPSLGKLGERARSEPVAPSANKKASAAQQKAGFSKTAAAYKRSHPSANN